MVVWGRHCKMYNPQFVFLPASPKHCLSSKTLLTALTCFVDWKYSLQKLHGVSVEFLQWMHFSWLKVTACLSGEHSSRKAVILSYEFLSHSFKLWFTSKYIDLATKLWHYEFWIKYLPCKCIFMQVLYISKAFETHLYQPECQ